MHLEIWVSDGSDVPCEKKRPPETLTWCHLFHDEADITGGKCSVAWLDQILLPGRGPGLGEAVLWRVARGHAACQ